LSQEPPNSKEFQEWYDSLPDWLKEFFVASGIVPRDWAGAPDWAESIQFAKGFGFLGGALTTLGPGYAAGMGIRAARAGYLPPELAGLIGVTPDFTYMERALSAQQTADYYGARYQYANQLDMWSAAMWGKPVSARSLGWEDYYRAQTGLWTARASYWEQQQVGTPESLLTSSGKFASYLVPEASWLRVYGFAFSSATQQIEAGAAMAPGIRAAMAVNPALTMQKLRSPMFWPGQLPSPIEVVVGSWIEWTAIQGVGLGLGRGQGTLGERVMGTMGPNLIQVGIGTAIDAFATEAVWRQWGVTPTSEQQQQARIYEITGGATAAVGTSLLLRSMMQQMPFEPGPRYSAFMAFPDRYGPFAHGLSFEQMLATGGYRGPWQPGARYGFDISEEAYLAQSGEAYWRYRNMSTGRLMAEPSLGMVDFVSAARLGLVTTGFIIGAPVGGWIGGQIQERLAPDLKVPFGPMIGSIIGGYGTAWLAGKLGTPLAVSLAKSYPEVTGALGGVLGPIATGATVLAEIQMINQMATLGNWGLATYQPEAATQLYKLNQERQGSGLGPSTVARMNWGFLEPLRQAILGPSLTYNQYMENQVAGTPFIAEQGDQRLSGIYMGRGLTVQQPQQTTTPTTDYNPYAYMEGVYQNRMDTWTSYLAGLGITTPEQFADYTNQASALGGAYGLSIKNWLSSKANYIQTVYGVSPEQYAKAQAAGKYLNRLDVSPAGRQTAFKAQWEYELNLITMLGVGEAYSPYQTGREGIYGTYMSTFYPQPGWELNKTRLNQPNFGLPATPDSELNQTLLFRLGFSPGAQIIQQRTSAAALAPYLKKINNLMELYWKGQITPGQFQSGYISITGASPAEAADYISGSERFMYGNRDLRPYVEARGAGPATLGLLDPTGRSYGFGMRVSASMLFGSATEHPYGWVPGSKITVGGVEYAYKNGVWTPVGGGAPLTPGMIPFLNDLAAPEAGYYVKNPATGKTEWHAGVVPKGFTPVMIEGHTFFQTGHAAGALYDVHGNYVGAYNATIGKIRRPIVEQGAVVGYTYDQGPLRSSESGSGADELEMNIRRVVREMIQDEVVMGHPETWGPSLERKVVDATESRRSMKTYDDLSRS
jgi:hypothetical protein